MIYGEIPITMFCSASIVMESMTRRSRNIRRSDIRTMFMRDFMNENFYIGCPTRDDRAEISSISILTTVAYLLKRNPVFIVQRATGLANVRNRIMDRLRKYEPNRKTQYIFWIDDDVGIDVPAGFLAEQILEAERRNISFSGAYHIFKDNALSNTAFKNFKEGTYSDKELENSRPFDLRLAHTGLGLAYIDMPFDYVFHTEGYKVEDYCFFEDNPEIEVWYLHIPNRHYKIFPI